MYSWETIIHQNYIFVIDLLCEKFLQAIKKKEKLYQQNTFASLQYSVVFKSDDH